MRTRVGLALLCCVFVGEVVSIGGDLVLCSGPGTVPGLADCRSIPERVEALAAKGGAILGIWGSGRQIPGHHP